MSWMSVLKAGQCYQLAFQFMLENEGKRMVHADVVGVGEKVKGQTYGHAFILLDDNTVWDVCQRMEFTKEGYYTMGNVTNEKIYTLEEAANKAVESGHYGPWE